MAITSENIRALNQDEHNEDAHAKRVVIRGQNPDDGNFYNIAAVDNGDGTFSLSTNVGTIVLGGSNADLKDDTFYGDGLTSGIASTALRVWNGSSYDRWDGTIATTSTPPKATDAYAISNIEDTGTYKYFGFEDADGAWYIMRKTISSSTFEYVKGASNYSTAWTNRASQTYGSYSSTF